MTLISVSELADLIDQPEVVLCDIRFYLADLDQGRREYDEAHIPGARFVDLHTELAGTTGGGRHPLPPVEDFVALLGRLGVGPGSYVIAYDSAGGATASRLWWMLRSVGHGRVSVLDGGYPAWVAANQPVTADVPNVTATEYFAAPDWTGVADADSVAQSLEFGGTVIDARSPERFRGEVEPIDTRAGHVPGAINLFHGGVLRDDGLHLSTPELADYFSEAGARPIVYCGSGVTACHTMLAMAHIGLAGARLYPGSWSEWSADPERPVATGD